MAFAPRMHVFPGGGVSGADLQTSDPLRACAIRETFEEVEIAVGSCALFDRWVTPESEERRYDVYFFVADVEDAGRLSTTEADSMLWLDPQEALDRHERGDLAMLRPTRAVLEDLAAGRVDTAPSEVVPKLPRMRPDGLWDLIDARTGDVLLSGTPGPTIAEVDGREMNP